MQRDSRKEVREEEFEWGADTIETEIWGTGPGNDRGDRRRGAGVNAGREQVAAGRHDAHWLPPRRARLLLPIVYFGPDTFFRWAGKHDPPAHEHSCDEPQLRDSPRHWAT